MSKIKKHLIGFDVLMLMVLLTTCLHQSALAQVDPCSKPKVAVIMQVVEVNEGEFFKHLNEQYPSQPKGSWFYEIQEKVMEELRMNSPGTQFIPATGGIPSDCDYSFKYGLSLTGGGEDIEYAGHLKLSEDTLYQMHSTLRKIPSCGKKTYVLSVKRTKNMDIFHTIEQNIVAHGNIGNKIKENEESHRVPPRGPEMKVSQDREYVSPLKEERKLKIKIDVINCKGEPVYDPKHGQEVILPKKTGRGELKCTDGFPEGCKATSNALTLIIQKPKGASATYTLKNGVNAEEDPINISTCGIDKKVVKETKIQIHGLELKVKPEKKEIFPGEETKITVELSEVDVKGAKQPVAGKHIQVQVKGLVNGHIHPSGDVTTNQNGKAILTYDAGDKDKKVVVKAKFQPKDYPEPVKDESAITIAVHGAGAELTLTDISKKHSDVHDPMAGDDICDSEVQITIKATFEYDDTYTYPLADEGEYEEYYNLTSWQILTANGNSKEHYRYFYGPNNHGCTSEILVNSEAKAANFSKGEKEDKEDASICITFNAKTGKAKEVEASFAFNGNFNWLGHSKEQFTVTDPKKGSRTDNKDRDINSNDYFAINLSPSRVKSGDGIHKMGGSETTTVPSHMPYDTGGYDQFLTKWEVVRHRK